MLHSCSCCVLSCCWQCCFCYKIFLVTVVFAESVVRWFYYDFFTCSCLLVYMFCGINIVDCCSTFTSSCFVIVIFRLSSNFHIWSVCWVFFSCVVGMVSSLTITFPSSFHSVVLVHILAIMYSLLALLLPSVASGFCYYCWLRLLTFSACTSTSCWVVKTREVILYMFDKFANNIRKQWHLQRLVTIQC